MNIYLQDTVVIFVNNLLLSNKCIETCSFSFLKDIFKNLILFFPYIYKTGHVKASSLWKGYDINTNHVFVLFLWGFLFVCFFFLFVLVCFILFSFVCFILDLLFVSFYFSAVSQSVSTISQIKYEVVFYFTRNTNTSEKVVKIMCLMEILELQVTGYTGCLKK